MVGTKDLAVQYASLGWRVVPVHTARDGVCSCGKKDCRSPGKHPTTLNGFNDARSDSRLVDRWWAQHPHANVGIATGEESGVWVLDIDGPEAAAELSRLAGLLGALPPTPTSKTGRGEHLFLRYDPDRPLKSRAKVRGLFDIRTDGGFVVAPPSVHASGSVYEWIADPFETPLADAPDWLFDHLESSDVKVRAVGDLPHDGELDLRTHRGVQEGGRHEMAARLIGAELARGTDPLEVVHLANKWADRCDPPFGYEEVHRITTDLRDKDARK